MKKSLYSLFRTIIEIILFLVSGVAIFIEFFSSSSVENGLHLLSFYTMQTNIMVFICMGFLVYCFLFKKKRTKATYFFIGGIAIWIMITGVLYHIFLSSIHNPSGIKSITNVLLHYVVPWSMVGYFVVFYDKRYINWIFPLLWTSYPIVYLIISLIRGKIQGFYPYWFINPTAEYPAGIGGMLNVFWFSCAITVCFVVAGYILLALRYVLSRKIRL
ncbi:MAG TPA: Pr6Pr family membrane protein [Petrotogaceae bacterium]|nr:Pr6Pr family membrane protein [Petrotogaceae bacterium]HQI78519.1 Pr6Pr family membrane protein [Petrotogaceae bacterium]